MMMKSSTVRGEYESTTDTFANFIEENKLYEVRPLEELKRLPGKNVISLAFDGNKILDKARENVQKNEPMSIYTTATPFEVYAIIDEYCGLIKEELTKYFSEVNSASSSSSSTKATTLKTVFLFNGCGFVPMLELNPTAPPQPPDEISKFKSALKTENVSSISANVQNLVANRFVIEPDVESMIVRRFHEFCPDTFRAPYLAWSQISAFLSDNNRYISEVYGCLELLAFPGVERVITEIDLVNKSVICVSKQQVMEKLQESYANLAADDFAGIVLLCSRNRQFKIDTLRMGFRQMCATSVEPSTKSRVETICNMLAESPQLMMFVRRNLSAFDAPVMRKDGQCVLLSNLYNLPPKSNIKYYFGQRLPSKFYYFLMGGPVMTESIATVSQRIFADDWPLIDSDAFRRIAEVVMPLRVQIAYQYFSVLELNDGLEWLRQYVLFKNDVNADKRLSQIKKPPQIKLAYWEVVNQNLIKESTDNVYFYNVLEFAECAVAEQRVYVDLETTLSAVLLRSLDLLGYFTHETNNGEKSSESAFCKALRHFTCPTLSEYGVLAIELFRTGALTDDEIKTLKNMNVIKYSRGLRFAARLLSIIPINLSKPWKGPFNVEIAAFGTLSRMYSRTYRLLTEVNATLLFYSNAVNIPLDQLDKVLEKLPFALPTEFSAGFLMTYILCNPNDTMEDLKLIFPEMMCIEDDLATLFWFWTMAFCAFMEIILNESFHIEKDLPPLLEAHSLVSDACKRLQPAFWQSLYEPLEESEMFISFSDTCHKKRMYAAAQAYNNVNGSNIMNNNNNNNSNMNMNMNMNMNNVAEYNHINNMNSMVGMNGMPNVNNMNGMGNMNQINNINHMHNMNHMVNVNNNNNNNNMNHMMNMGHMNNMQMMPNAHMNMDYGVNMINHYN